jgi:hypothetical protein
MRNDGKLCKLMCGKCGKCRAALKALEKMERGYASLPAGDHGAIERTEEERAALDHRGRP